MKRAPFSSSFSGNPLGSDPLIPSRGITIGDGRALTTSFRIGMQRESAPPEIVVDKQHLCRDGRQVAAQKTPSPSLLIVIPHGDARFLSARRAIVSVEMRRRSRYSLTPLFPWTLFRAFFRLTTQR